GDLEPGGAGRGRDEHRGGREDGQPADDGGRRAVPGPDLAGEHRADHGAGAGGGQGDADQRRGQADVADQVDEVEREFGGPGEVAHADRDGQRAQQPVPEDIPETLHQVAHDRAGRQGLLAGRVFALADRAYEHGGGDEGSGVDGDGDRRGERLDEDAA